MGMVVDFAADISQFGRLFVLHNPIIADTLQLFSFGWELTATEVVPAALGVSCSSLPT